MRKKAKGILKKLKNVETDQEIWVETPTGIRQNKTDPPTCNCTEEIIRVETATLLVFRDPAFHFRLHPRQVGLQSRVHVRWQNL
jgi:hypothetical protein